LSTITTANHHHDYLLLALMVMEALCFILSPLREKENDEE
jgi:hypothetical protein